MGLLPSEWVTFGVYSAASMHVRTLSRRYSCRRTSNEQDRKPHKPFFPVRTRRMTRALGSPKIPETMCWGGKPGNRYVLQSLRYRAMENQYHFLTPVPTYESLVPKRFSAYSMTNFTHSIGRRPNKSFYQNPSLKFPLWL